MPFCSPPCEVGKTPKPRASSAAPRTGSDVPALTWKPLPLCHRHRMTSTNFSQIGKTTCIPSPKNRISSKPRCYRRILDSAKRPPIAAAGVLDSLFGSPMLSIAVHAGRCGESFQNVSKAVAFWQKHGLVTEITNQRRHRIFAAPEILKLTRPKP